MNLMNVRFRSAPPGRSSLRSAVAFAAVLTALGSAPAVAQDPLLWGSLKPGRHAVGYRTLYRLDHSRQYDPEFATDSTKLPAHKPRPIYIAVWYPAQKTDAKPMEYRQYLDASSDDPLFAPFAKRLSRHWVAVVSEETVGKEPAYGTSAETAAFERLMATKTFAVKDAPPAEGRFPVVIHHPGLSGVADDSSVLCEMLASHGYVVLCSAYPNWYAEGVGISSDLHTSFRDMELLIRYARELPFADADRLGAMGHSWGAIAVLHWAALADSSLRAYVTLDSGFEYGSVEDCGFEPLIFHMRTNKGNIRAASLRFASTERKPNFDLLDPHLTHSPRYGVAVSGLTHNDFVMHGAIRPALMAEKWCDPKGTRRTAYDRLCRHILLFFDSTLKQKAAAREALQKSVQGEGLDEGFRLTFKPAAPAPPTHAQLASYLKEHGVEKTVAWIKSIPNLPTQQVASAAFVLLKDHDATSALPALRYVTKEYPKVTGYQVWLGQALGLTGDREGALAAYRKAAELLRTDKTAGTWRENSKYLINKGLKELGEPETSPKDRQAGT
jgi:hypothetical protein